MLKSSTSSLYFSKSYGESLIVARKSFLDKISNLVNSTVLNFSLESYPVRNAISLKHYPFSYFVIFEAIIF